MTSTIPIVASGAAADSAQQNSFNPSWYGAENRFSNSLPEMLPVCRMRSAFNGGGGAVPTRSPSTVRACFFFATSTLKISHQDLALVVTSSIPILSIVGYS